MLSIEFEDHVETVKIGDLFDELGFTSNLPVNDKDNDTCIRNNWPISVESLDEFYEIEGLRWTKPETTVTLTVQTTSGELLQLNCADEHLVHQQEPARWIFVRDLVAGDKLICESCIGEVVSVIKNNVKDRLCDMQVSICHSYFANGILSHNSHWLVAMGAHALKIGKNVVHYTFELTETSVGLRYDSNLCGVSSSDVPDMKDEILKQYETMDLGRLIIKEYPTGAATVQTLRNHIEKLSLKGFVPNVIIIDYADIMRSSRTFDSLRHELKLVYEELRNLAMELNLPIWTASQSNREGSNAEVVGLENMSEAYGKAMVADVVMSLSRKPSEKADGSGRLFVAKNRAGKDGVLFPIHIDTSQSRIKILDENSLTLSESMTQDDNDAKKLLRKKWLEVTGNK